MTASFKNHQGGSQRSQSSSSLLKAILRFVELLLFSVCVSLVLSLLGLVLYEGYYLRRIYPGVRALSIPLGGLTPSQAVVALPQEVNPYLERPLRLSYGDRVWVVDAAQVGVRFDRPAMARLAYGAGRGHGLRVDLWQQLAIFEAGYEVSYQLAWDQDTADRFLADLAGQINRPARDATLELRGLRVITTPSQVGWKLDVTASRERIFSQLADLAGGEVELVVREVPPELPEVGQAPQGVRRILSGPITLRLPQNAIESASSGPWVISPDLLASALHIERIEGSSRDKLAVHLKADLLRSQIELLAEELALPSVDARLGYDPDRGTFTELTPSRLGQRLDVEAALERVLAAAEGERREVLLPLTPLRPTVTAANARDLGIRELVAEGITSFEGSSQDRIQNIATAASCFHGVVVRSGEVFSFNEHLGEVSAEEGYEESLIIVGDRTRMGIGGGVCQVATTAFRAAFWGGYPIEERWAHGYRVRVYEPPIGLDATVYAPDVDFKFRNDTPYYLLIQTEVDRQTKTVAFRFYSTSVGRRVEMEEPIVENRVPHEPPIIEEDPTLPAGTRKQVDWAVDGLDVTVIRRVYEGQRLVHEDRFFSRYEPWQARFLVGTKPAG